MEQEPWQRQRAALDGDAVRALLAAQFPALRLQSVQPLGEGWDCETWLVDGTVVFRFPKRAEVQASLEREGVLLPLLQQEFERAGLEVVLPVPRWQGQASERFPYVFAGYRLVPGRSRNWSLRPSTVLSAFEDDLLRFLEVLHGCTAKAEAVLADHDLSYPVDYAPLDWQAELRRVGPTLQARLSAAALEVVTPLLRGEVEPPPPFAGEPRLLHFDLAEEHVLMDPVGGGITGIIDWADAGFGDPAIDFIEPTIWLGPAFLERAVARYGHPLDAGFRNRVRYGAAVVALLNAAYGYQRGDEALGRRRQRHLEAVMLPAGELGSWHR